jgi:hypothetical protein
MTNTNFKIGDKVERIDTIRSNGRLIVVKGNLKKTKTFLRNGEKVKYIKTKDFGTRQYSFGGGSARHLSVGAYTVEGFTSNGGVLLCGFLLPVSSKHLKTVK